MGENAQVEIVPSSGLDMPIQKSGKKLSEQVISNSIFMYVFHGHDIEKRQPRHVWS